jgi:hypothetical protein
MLPMLTIEKIEKIKINKIFKRKILLFKMTYFPEYENINMILFFQSDKDDYIHLCELITAQ